MDIGGAIGEYIDVELLNVCNRGGDVVGPGCSLGCGGCGPLLR